MVDERLGPVHPTTALVGRADEVIDVVAGAHSRSVALFHRSLHCRDSSGIGGDSAVPATLRILGVEDQAQR
jgi:hypothetical protein